MSIVSIRVSPERINAVRPLFVGAVIEIRSVTFVYLAALALSVDDFQVLLTVP